MTLLVPALGLWPEKTYSYKGGLQQGLYTPWFTGLPSWRFFMPTFSNLAYFELVGNKNL